MYTKTTLARHEYFPFGEEATSPTQDDHRLKFTGHERDDLDLTGTTGDLDYMHARFFSAHLGRMWSTDPVGAAAVWPQSWNRYGYVLGNPMKYIDPEGLWPFFPVGDVPIGSFDESITVTGNSISLGYLNFLGFGNFLRNISFLNNLSNPSTRLKTFQTLHERADVQQFFACLSIRSRATDQEAAGLIHIRSTGALDFSLRMGERERVLVGNLSDPRLIGVAHPHPPDGPTGFVSPAQGNANDFLVAIHTKGFGGSRVPNYILHPRGGVTRYLSGVDTLPGNQVLETGFDKGMRNVCQGIGTF